MTLSMFKLLFKLWSTLEYIGPKQAPNMLFNNRCLNLACQKTDYEVNAYKINAIDRERESESSDK